MRSPVIPDIPYPFPPRTSASCHPGLTHRSRYRLGARHVTPDQLSVDLPRRSLHSISSDTLTPITPHPFSRSSFEAEGLQLGLAPKRMEFQPGLKPIPWPMPRPPTATLHRANLLSPHHIEPPVSPLKPEQPASDPFDDKMNPIRRCRTWWKRSSKQQTRASPYSCRSIR